MSTSVKLFKMNRYAIMTMVVVVAFIAVDQAGAQTIIPRVLHNLNQNAATDSGSDEYPNVATDGAGFWIAVWKSIENLGGAGNTETDIFFSRSADNGTTWTVPAFLFPDSFASRSAPGPKARTLVFDGLTSSPNLPRRLDRRAQHRLCG